MDHSGNIYINEAQKIISLLKKDFILANGALCINRHYDYKSPYHALPDLGDIVPFLIYFKEFDLVEAQIEALKKNLVRGILISELPAFHIKHLAKSYEYSDLLLGLLDYHLYKNDEASRRLLFTIADKAIEIFNFSGSFNSFYWPTWNLHFPIKDSRDGMMIELFNELHSLSQDKKYLDVAYNIYQQLVKTNFYQQHHIFPTFSTNSILPKFSSKFSQGKIGKANTNTLFALLSLWVKTKDQNILEIIIQTVEAIRIKVMSKGGVGEVFNPKNKNFKICLTPSFALLDFLCDFYYYHKRVETIDLAKSIAHYWLDRQAKSGLFPLYDQGQEDFLDSETDMSVALYKLYELTREEKYKNSADACLAGIIKMHGSQNYVMGVDIDNGQVLNPGQKSKFLTLFLKLLILKLESDKGKKIYVDQELFNLLKDR